MKARVDMVNVEYGYPRLGVNKDEDILIKEYMFLLTDYGNTMYVENRMYRFLDNNAICPKCGKIIKIFKNESEG